MCCLGQSRTYYKHHPKSLTLGKSKTQLKFDEKFAHAFAKIVVKIPNKEGTHPNLSIDVVDTDIPLIIGLDVLGVNKKLVDYITETINYCNYNVKRPIKHKMGTDFLEWNQPEIWLTRA